MKKKSENSKQPDKVYITHVRYTAKEAFEISPGAGVAVLESAFKSWPELLEQEIRRLKDEVSDISGDRARMIYLDNPEIPEFIQAQFSQRYQNALDRCDSVF